jgi:hypothetical protein
MKDLKKHSQAVLASLQEAVTEALEMKRKLGQYAVIVENGQPRRVPAEHIEALIVAAKATK